MLNQTTVSLHVLSRHNSLTGVTAGHLLRHQTIHNMRKATQEEVKRWDFNPAYGRYGLLDKSKDSLFFTADTLLACTDTLNRMTPQHPKYNDMELVVAPDPVAE